MTARRNVVAPARNFPTLSCTISSASMARLRSLAAEQGRSISAVVDDAIASYQPPKRRKGQP